MNKISYGTAKLSEALLISVLLKTVNVQTYATSGISFEIANYITQRFSPEYIENSIKENEDRLLVAYKNENPIGVAEIIYNATCPIRKINVPELSKLYVLDRFHGQGIGHGLLKEVEKQVLKTEAQHLYLEVYVENASAISFYQRQGYEIIGEVDFPMQDNVYKNWVMSKALK